MTLQVIGELSTSRGYSNHARASTTGPGKPDLPCMASSCGMAVVFHHWPKVVAGFMDIASDLRGARHSPSRRGFAAGSTGYSQIDGYGSLVTTNNPKKCMDEPPSKGT